MLLLVVVAFLLKRYGTQAIPLPVPSSTPTSFEPPIFARDNPSDGCHSRTVLDILWSCLATTFACTWVSVHPNVPFKGEGKWTLLRRRVFLMFFSIFAPEFMIMWAFKQWRGAVMIKVAVNDAIEKAFHNSQKLTPEPWTTTHGHLLQMGGFRVSATLREIGSMRRTYSVKAWRYREELALILEPFHYRHELSEGSWTTDYYPNAELTDDIWEGVLTFNTLKHLLSKNLITLPTITEDEINDKSKGDALSKGIALLQLTWFIVQIITRAVQGLAITELELTTAALAGLNSVMYIFWWSKPRDVRFPMVVRTKGVEELLAKRLSEDVTWTFSRQEFDIRKHLWASLATWTRVFLDAACHFIASLASKLISIFLRSVEHVKTLPRRLTFIFSRNLLLRARKPTTTANEGEMLLVVDDEPSCKVENRIKRYALMLAHGAKSAMNSALVPFFCLVYIIDVVLIIPIAKILQSDDDEGSISGGFLDEVGGLDVQTEEKIFSMIFYSENASVSPLLSTSAIAGALFGAVHCLAWHFSFPSHAEQILWRTASLGIVGSCVVTFITVLCADLIDRLGNVFQLFGLAALAPGGIASFVYPVARITLLVLAITSLRSLPSSAFDTVDWVEFVPHI